MMRRTLTIKHRTVLLLLGGALLLMPMAGTSYAAPGGNKGGGGANCSPPPVWDENITNNRFVPALDGVSAYCDTETGLTWEAAPPLVTASWNLARFNCADKEVRGRKGWRLPSFAEIATLIDVTQGPPTLPAGHPFQNIQMDLVYWTATTRSVDTTLAWTPLFSVGAVGTSAKTGQGHYWCVRGAMNADVY